MTKGRFITLSSVEEELFREMWARRAPYKEMTFKFDMSLNALKRIAKDFGLPPRRHYIERGRGLTIFLPEKQREWIKLRSKLKHISQSDYIRTLIEKDLQA